MPGIPKLVVFVHDEEISPNQTILIKKLNDMGYSPMVDAMHAGSYDWFVTNVKTCPHKLFTIDEEDIFFFEVDQLKPEMNFLPDFLVYFNEGDELSVPDWVCIKHWIRFHLFENMMETDFVLTGDKLMLKPHKEVVVAMDPPPEMKRVAEGDSCYSYRAELVEEDDIMIYEIRKPYTDLPYSSVIRNFSTSKPQRFFTSLYVCPSWGVSRYDLVFLKQLWVHEFKLKTEEFNMDEMLKEATEACYPRPGIIPEPEPEVYRRALEDVKQILKERKEGKVCGTNKTHGIPQDVRKELREINEELEATLEIASPE